MADIVEQILRASQDAADLYHRLVIVAGPSGSGKTVSVQKVADHLNTSIINVNLRLSESLLDLPHQERIINIGRLLGDLIADFENDVVILDNTEILFEADLKQNPLVLLQNLSRNRTIVTTWSGAVDKDSLTYAVPGHKEYRKYKVKDIILINTEDK